ncbi:type I-F CRISPR-associated helicase Cas3 [Candidatus Methylospira mobilis]|uniref:Type I-F CRISPR-associated helicase Cas3 n=1 Tax=Candidatus Methylospira mobilis TaxID=1808979 RepID=A0A5Q0BRZ4_9GAMM|nr:type I-F CRISPR-associated helicase Cas3f [Candidatus Methylospira mobilis]QFY44837.1 type I-F CRISPR-associated helicase Cas3 [Candidatus Methylospira mobilis]
MMVTFVSQCEKNALNKTRRVLDSFADRIGDCTWQTVITSDGLDAVKKLLRKTASKNTAVSCHWLRSRGRSELVWIVGNRKKFNAQGIVPVHSTRKTVINTQWENDWRLLPLIKALAALAALFHDWGKASLFFQSKLKPGKSKKIIADPLRHEWVSCLLLHAFVNGDSDECWLSRLAAGEIDEAQLKTILAANATHKPLAKLPPAASMLAWLMVAHHRLPLPQDSFKGAPQVTQFELLFSVISAEFGYRNSDENIADCLTFPKGLPSRSARWLKQAKKWAVRLQDALPLLQQAVSDGSYRLILQHARLSLMLGDHHYSSQDADKQWGNALPLYANTDKKTGRFKQALDEHLIGVARQTLINAQLLPAFEDDVPRVYDVKRLKQKSADDRFRWQDKAVEKIKAWKAEENTGNARYGFFAVNMASTGCGKTLANAKIMQALSVDGDSLRYALALGLRTLTLQTGQEYRDRIGLDDSELAVMIGSRAVMELHRQTAEAAADAESDHEKNGSESTEELWEDNAIDFEIPDHTLSALSTVWCDGNGKADERKQKFLYAPVLACTIDHLMAATETKRGGRYILPYLRLMSSDLVIDEIDDFDGDDLVAIGRLIHLAGMLGRKVMISSATIPPDLAEGYFNAYQQGWRLFALTRDIKHQIGCAWIDEFATRIETVQDAEIPVRRQSYRQAHQHFIEKRSGQLQKQPVRRIAEIVACIPSDCDETGMEQQYFAVVQQAIIVQHRRHALTDPHSGKYVSFGVVRMANIPPCIRLTQYLAQAQWPETVDMRVMAYHSQQVLLLRHAQEKHLDTVLKRSKRSPFDDTLIRRHLDHSTAENLIFILVATPVEEVGRDHDFDWAVVEPSSYRSIIQLAGRILRHRFDILPQSANIALMQYNLKALKQQRPAYCRPGYESEKFPLASHDLMDLIPGAQLANINALPRIRRNAELRPDNNLADLEHASIRHLLTAYDDQGPQALQGWLDECWWLTALPQHLKPFRKQDNHQNLYLMPEGKFVEKTPDGGINPVETYYKIHRDPSDQAWSGKLWLHRDYEELLEQQAERQGLSLLQAALRYGEISVRIGEKEKLSGNGFEYSDQLGMWKKQ